MSNCDNAKNKVSHPLQCVLMKSTTEEHVHSWTSDLAAHVTGKAAHKLEQSNCLKWLI